MRRGGSVVVPAMQPMRFVKFGEGRLTLVVVLFALSIGCDVGGQMLVKIGAGKVSQTSGRSQE